MSRAMLEHNVGRLLRRSYVPALPAAHFRDQLESLFLRELERRAGRGRRTDGPRSLPRRAAALLALAAALVAVLLGWRRFADTEPTLDGLLEGGQVALLDPTGAWRAADAEERFHGLAFVPPSLLVATPEDADFQLLLGFGRVQLEARSELELRESPLGATAMLHFGSARFLNAEQELDLVPGRTLELARPSPPNEPAVAGPAVAEVPRTTVREELEPGPAREPAVVATPARLLEGVVLDAASGEPLREFTLAFLREQRSNMAFPPTLYPITSTDGRFALADPPTGKQRIFVHASGHALCSLGEFDLSGELPTLRAELEVGFSVYGIVIDRNWNPIAGALVISEDDAPTDGLMFGNAQPFWLPVQTRSGPDGGFELEHLSVGEHTLRFSADGMAPSWVEGVSADSAADGLEVELGPGGRIEGRVTRADGGPWAGVQMVTLSMEQNQRPLMNFGVAYTDDDGRYGFDNVPPTAMIVVMLGDESRPDVRPVSVSEEGVAQVDFALARTGATIVGRLLDSEGSPVPLQNLGLFDHETASWDQDWVASSTDAEGGFTFDGVQPGAYLVYLIDEMGRGLRCIDEIDVPAGVPEVLHDVHTPSGELDLSVSAASDGAPLGQAAVHLSRVREGGSAHFAAMGTTDDAGSYHFKDLPPGNYDVVAYPTTADLGFSLPRRVHLDGIRATQLEILLEEGGTLEILVNTPSGSAVKGAAIIFHDERGAEHILSRAPITDSAGRYRATGLRPGRYRVTAILENRIRASRSIDFEPGRPHDLALILTLDPTTPAGTDGGTER